MRRRNSLALTGILLSVVLCFSGCIKVVSSKEAISNDPVEVYERTMEKMMALPYLDLESVESYNISMDAYSLQMDAEAEIQLAKEEAASDISDQDSAAEELSVWNQISCKLGMNMGNYGKFEMAFYYLDECLYLDEGDTKCYIDASGLGSDYAYTSSIIDSIDSYTGMTTLPDVFKNSLTMERSNGKYILSFSIEECDMNDFFASTMENIAELIDDSTEMKFYDICGKIVVNTELYLESYELSYRMDASMSGVNCSLQTSVQTGYKNPGQIGTIDFPDFSTYEPIQ